MEAMNRSVLSSAPAIRGGHTSQFQANSRYFSTFSRSCRPWSGPFSTKGTGNCYCKHQAALPFSPQVRACSEAPSSSHEEVNGNTLDASSQNETEGVNEEVCDQVVGMQHLAVGVSIAVAFVVAFTDVGSATARSGEIDLPPVEPEVATISSIKEISLAKQLKAIGAKMYGAFWCSHCFEQKQMFGKEAMKYIEYVECYPDGYRRGVKLASACSAASIRGFPTWVINGQQYSGEQELDKLAELSGLNVAQQVMK